MFSGDDAEKKIKVLSGGERSRVLLGKLLVAPSNILFLDEPTHHLDIESCQAMMDAVKDFEGAALVVAHDEHFLHEVATKLVVFKNDRAFFYPGRYSEFLEDIGWEDEEDGAASKGGATSATVPSIPPEPQKRQEASENSAQNKEVSGPASNISDNSKAHTSKMKRKVRAEFVAMRSKILKPLEEKIKAMEEEIIASEKRVAAVNEELARGSAKGGLGALRRSELSRELKELAEKIDSCYAQLDIAMRSYDSEKVKYEDEVT